VSSTYVGGNYNQFVWMWLNRKKKTYLEEIQHKIHIRDGQFNQLHKEIFQHTDLVVEHNNHRKNSLNCNEKQNKSLGSHYIVSLLLFFYSDTIGDDAWIDMNFF
jgi:hypothetical protein